MPYVQFQRVRPDAELYEVFVDGWTSGLVWEDKCQWFADPVSTAYPMIAAADRDTAVQLLLEAKQP